MKKSILALILVVTCSAFCVTGAELPTLEFNAPIASVQQVESGWRWLWNRDTGTWARFVTNITTTLVDINSGSTVTVTNIVDKGPVPTFVNYCRSNIQNAFNGHGNQLYVSKLSEQAERAKAKQIKDIMSQLEAGDLALLYQITAALQTNQAAISNAVFPVINQNP
jgi:hypothetical protein